MCRDWGVGLWVEQNSGNTDSTNTAEFNYEDDKGFTLYYGKEEEALASLETTPDSGKYRWPILPERNRTACDCCKLCRAQPNTNVSAGRQLQSAAVLDVARYRLWCVGSRAEQLYACLLGSEWCQRVCTLPGRVAALPVRALTLPALPVPGCPGTQSYRTSNKCKAWSFRFEDGACRLFTNSPFNSNNAVKIQSDSDEEQLWHSGTGALAVVVAFVAVAVAAAAAGADTGLQAGV